MRGMILAGLIVCGAGAAAAQDRPVWPPTRDAAVTYVMTGANRPPGMPNEMTMSLSSSLGKMRMDVGQEVYMITDLRSRSIQMVMPGQKMVMTMAPGGNAAPQMFDPSKIDNAVRKGSDRVAGESCTVWDVTVDGHAGTFCTTAEGIMLRASSPAGGTMEATKVSYGTVPASVFAVPAGYQTMQMPTGAGARRP